MELTRTEKSAVQRLIEKIERDHGTAGSVDVLLKDIAELLDADHAEVSIWRFDAAGDRSLARRIVFDPHAMNLALFPLRTDEHPHMGGNVHTWECDTEAPGRGGPALLSARACDERQVILVALRRKFYRQRFTARQALVLNALNQCQEFCSEIVRHVASS